MNKETFIPRIFSVQQTAVWRAAWFLLVGVVLILVVTAVPRRYAMLMVDIYGYGAALAELGLSLRFFAAYFTFWELVVVAGSLLVSALIAWRKADDWFALLVAIMLVLYGLLPPLLDGLILLDMRWQWPIGFLRTAELCCLMAVLSMFPNGRFQPRWTRWLLILWTITSVIFFIIYPQTLASTAVIPNTRTARDALLLLIGVAWFSVGIAAQLYRFRRLSTPEERQQTKWVLFGFIIVVVFSLISTLFLINVPFVRDDPIGRALFVLSMGLVYLLSALVLPIMIAFAMLRYRLWEVDFYINRTLVYGALTALITAVYILLVGSLGTLTMGQSGRAAGLVIATLIVIVLIKPLRIKLQMFTNRIVPLSKAAPGSVAADKIAASQKKPVLYGRSLILARLFWVVILILGIMLYVMGTILLLREGLFSALSIGDFNVGIALLRLTTTLSSDGITTPVWVVSSIQMIAFLLIGLLIFWRKSTDRMGILASVMLITVGIGFTANVFLLPLIDPIWHPVTTIFQIVMFGAGQLFLFWFPNGRYYPGWTRGLMIAWFVYALLWLPFPQLNPHRSDSIWVVVIFVAWVWLGIGTQFIRYRRESDLPQRQQTQWVIAGFVVANFGFFCLILLSWFLPTNLETIFSLPIYLIPLIIGMGAILIPVTIAIALFRYRLWEIDFIINRTLVYAGLTAFVFGMYALVVGGLGFLFQSSGNFMLALLATGLIAVLFQPLRDRMQHGVNRLMFGERDDPYGVLSRLGRQLRETAVPDQTLPAITNTIIQTLKLPYAAIELASSANGRQIAAASGQQPKAAQGWQLVEWPLLYQGEIVGWLLVAPRSPGELFTTKEQQLLEDIAAQAGTVAYSVRLTSALQRSRERLVLAREEERRRIRRDLHDGLGPSLASQTFQLDAALDLLDDDPQATAVLLRSLKSQNQLLVADIRRLVYELRPPALDELGLFGALEAHIGQMQGEHTSNICLQADPSPLPALSAAVDVAAYRIILEGINNVVRHAQAKNCTVDLAVVATQLQITITDDGMGMPPQPQKGIGLNSMRERAEELGGVLLIGSLAKGGTRITAVLPIGD